MLERNATVTRTGKLASVTMSIEYDFVRYERRFNLEEAVKAAVLQQQKHGGGDGQEEAADPAAASAAAAPMPPVQLVAIRHIPRHVKSSLATSILIPSNGSASLSPHSERFHHPSPPHGHTLLPPLPPTIPIHPSPQMPSGATTTRSRANDGTPRQN